MAHAESVASAPQLLIDEIAKLPRARPMGTRGATKSSKAPKVMPSGQTAPSGEHDADKTTVERHTALPHLEQPEGILDQSISAIEERVTKPTTEDDANARRRK